LKVECAQKLSPESKITMGNIIPGLHPVVQALLSIYFIRALNSAGQGRIGRSERAYPLDDFP
jgi:hypothetical protein